ncbi:nucleophile aminohydrolase [Chytriomyces cf. hyalinus JEL632]|nr:nucleophile aminohydrolase [Chytriomyces cf. hyalinus JEL632]
MVKEIASITQEFTQSGGVRPFGMSLLIAGFDDLGLSLYQVDPSGSYSETMEFEDALHTAILTLKEGYEGAMAESGIEIGIAYLEHTTTKEIDKIQQGRFKKLSEPEIKDNLANL